MPEEDAGMGCKNEGESEAGKVDHVLEKFKCSIHCSFVSCFKVQLNL